MEFQDKINALLIPMTHYFSVARMPELAMANILALTTMNLPNQRDKYFLLMNGIFTYLMGYTFFIEQKPSSGVYMFLLGLVCMGRSVAGQLQMFLDDWNERFRVRKEVVYDESDDEQHDTADAATPPESATEETPVPATATQSSVPEAPSESQD